MVVAVVLIEKLSRAVGVIVIFKLRLITGLNENFEYIERKLMD